MVPPTQLRFPRTRAAPHWHRQHPLSHEFLLLALVLLLIVAIVGAVQHEQAESDDGADFSAAELLLPLPAPVSQQQQQQQQQWRLGETLSLDELGPIIINADGTTRRIGNWKQLSKWEQERTLVRIAKRNQERVAALRKEVGEGTREEEL